jgi:CPA2 family monovalent cation:H+ antiporter-2
MPVFAADTPIGHTLVEIGLAVIGLAVLTRFAHRVRVSSVPLFLTAGMVLGARGLVPLPFSDQFVEVGAEIGVVLLLFMLGLEYTGDQLRDNLRTGLPAGLADLVLNFPPGLVTGWLLGWSTLAAVLLGGVTYISSSGIVAKLLVETGRQDRPETPTVMSVLVLEDLAMAVYLPVVAVLLVGRWPGAAAAAVAIALAAVGVVLLVAVRFGPHVSRVLHHHSDETVLLTVFGLVLTVAGLAERVQISAAVGAFLVGVALSGRLAEKTHQLVTPLRDLFSALFFLFVGLQIDPKSLPHVLLPAAGLAVVTAGTKVLTGWWAGRRAGLETAARWRAGTILIARGEFSVVIAGLGAGLEPQLAPLSAAYVLILAVAGPITSRLVK